MRMGISWVISNLYIKTKILCIYAMKELSVTEAREQFPALLNQAVKNLCGSRATAQVLLL